MQTRSRAFVRRRASINGGDDVIGLRVDDEAEIRPSAKQVIEADDGLRAMDPHIVESRPVSGHQRPGVVG